MERIHMAFRKLALGALTLYGCSILSPAHAADYQWQGGNPTRPTDWNVEDNWFPRGVPGPSDRAFVGSNKTVNVPSAVIVSSLSLDTDSTLQGDGMVTVNQSLAVKDATLDGAGSLELPQTCVATFDSVLPPSSGAKNTKSKKKVKNKGKVNLNSGDLVLSAEFENDVEGTVEIKTDGAITWAGIDKPKFRNKGRLVKSAGAALSTITAPVENTGTIISQAGTLHLGPEFKQKSGRTQMNGGDLSSDAPLVFEGGTLEGTGKVNADVINKGGQMRPGHSPGAITILGNFTQTAAGSLNMEIAGLNPGAQYDQISVQGTATLAGTLNITWIDNFQPNPGDSFTLMEYFNSNGTFSTISGLFPGAQRYLTTSYTSSYFIASANTDTTPPHVDIVSPAPSALLTSAFTVSGTASDSESGVSNVTVRLYRFASSNQPAGYWNGSTWDVDYLASKHERVASGTTNWSLALPKLPSGKYTLRATASDKVKNQLSSGIVPINVDSVAPPILTIASLVNGAVINKLPPIYGSVVDDTNGSGLASVTFTLRQIANGAYWTGSAWGASTALPTTLSSGAWRASSPMPSNTTLPNSTYQVVATAKDKAGLSKTVTLSFTIDAAAPVIKISTPTNGGVFKDLPSTTGTASDNLKVQSVTVKLYRYASAEAPASYWNGTAWDATYNVATHELLATGTTNWSRSLLTNAITRKDGKYYVQLTAKDSAGNIGTATNILWIDSVAPALTIDTPPPGALITKLPSIAGTVADNLGGQGLVRTDLQIRRVVDNRYWTGSAWSLAPTLLSTGLGSGRWSRIHTTAPLPSGANLLDGQYALTAIAYDKAGNSKSATSSFILDQTPPSVIVTSPKPEGSYQQLSAIVGTAADTTAGINKVTVRLFRYAKGATPSGYWASGDNWNSSYSAAANEILATGTTSWSVTLPALEEGRYFCAATVTDKAGFTATTAACVFTLDRTAPTVAFTRPEKNPAIYKSLASVAGTAADAGGLGKVTVRLFRYAKGSTPSGYWAGGGTWTTSYNAVANEQTVTGTTSWSLTLPALAEGRYFALATATDKTGNVTSTEPSIFTIDASAPTVSINQPLTNNSILKELTAAGGTASDSIGLSKVTVRLYRYATATAAAGYWAGGDTWTAAYTVAANELSAIGTEAWSLALPSLPEGRYYFQATAFDEVGNNVSSPAWIFTIDTTGPVVVFTTPADNARLRSLGSISGTATAAGAATDIVKLLIQRGDGLFWTGTAWGEAANLTTTYNASTKIWSNSGALPAGVNLPDGVYTLTANASDKAGNLSTASRTINIDNTPPDVSITAPADGTVYTATPEAPSSITASGAAADAGSGVSNVKVALYREAGPGITAGYWNGIGWDAVYNAVRHEHPANGTAEWTWSLPVLNVGNYSLRATALDSTGNAGASVPVAFAIMVPEPPPTEQPPAEPLAVQLSSATVDTAGGFLHLLFTGALEPVGANTPALYAVTINGQPVAAVSALYNVADNSVLLSLPPGALNVGDEVVVAWNDLHDLQNNVVSGQTQVLVAG